ncbi:MAG TPA: tripartite tricarboxylate transporter TctB family protein [Thermodesulfobacteriota bacterium]|nr:tripartite tricarboxylate transporter TctB family protein [Thermodesulfobacteriota bacterium]
MGKEPIRDSRFAPQVVTGLVVWAVVAGLIGFTRGLPYIEEGAPGPRFMPLVLAVFLSFLNVLYWIETFRTRKKLSLPRLSQLVRPAGFFLVGLLMIFLWERLGVVATVLLSSFLELKWIEGYAWGRSLWVGAALSVSTWVLFQVLLGIPLPTGPFEWLSFV